MKIIRITSATLALILVVGCASLGLTGTIQTHFTTVMVKDLAIGFKTVVRLDGGERYNVENRTANEIEVAYSAVTPAWIQPDGGGFIPIPDIKWVTITPSQVKIKSGKKGEVDVEVSVPDDARYANKKYEFWIRAETVGGSVGVALISRVRVNTIEKPSQK